MHARCFGPEGPQHDGFWRWQSRARAPAPQQKRSRAVTCYGSGRRCDVSTVDREPSASSALKVLVEADENWLGDQLNAEGVGHTLLNFVFQSKNVVGSGVAAVHDGQRVLA